jgi:hypothetical protein
VLRVFGENSGKCRHKLLAKKCVFIGKYLFVCTGAYIYYELGVITTQVARNGSWNCVTGEIKEPVWVAATAWNLNITEKGKADNMRGPR